MADPPPEIQRNADGSPLIATVEVLFFADGSVSPAVATHPWSDLNLRDFDTVSRLVVEAIDSLKAHFHTQ